MGDAGREEGGVPHLQHPLFAAGRHRAKIQTSSLGVSVLVHRPRPLGQLHIRT